MDSDLHAGTVGGSTDASSPDGDVHGNDLPEFEIPGVDLKALLQVFKWDYDLEGYVCNEHGVAECIVCFHQVDARLARTERVKTAGSATEPGGPDLDVRGNDLPEFDLTLVDPRAFTKAFQWESGLGGYVCAQHGVHQCMECFHELDLRSRPAELGPGAGARAKEVAKRSIERVQKTVTQSDAFEAFNAAMEEMTVVVSVQHARISDLERRVLALEHFLTTPGQRKTSHDE